MQDTKTTSLCHICYRHCVAERVTMPDGVYLKKTCVDHGESTHLLETDINFYNQLEYDKSGYSIPQGVMIEVTDKCNLNCPHCYHLGVADLLHGGRWSHHPLQRRSCTRTLSPGPVSAQSQISRPGVKCGCRHTRRLR